MKQTTDWEHGLEHAALSDVGLRRPANQDCLAVVPAGDRPTWRARGHLFVVADGMGASAAGELASEMAVEALLAGYRKTLGLPPPQALRLAMREANRQIYEKARSNHELHGMGTTLSALVLLPQGALVAHVGDSRVYRLRSDRLEQLTFDHSLVWEVCAAERVLPSCAPSHVPRNIITRSVGPRPEVEADLEGIFPLQVGDTFLLCSDGLTGLVDDEELGTILRCLPPNDAVRAATDLALLRGGYDNVTAVVVRAAGPQAVGRPDVDWLAKPLGPETDTWPESSLDRQRLGKGPYVAADCVADDRFARRLADVVEELRSAAAGAGEEIQWSRLDVFRDRAAAALEGGDHTHAVREYFRAIRSVLGQLTSRRQTTEES
ncbi:MAG: PP2C family protein-serine/threonine phosphatase [Planctomycetota bacterium]|jgi:protein phosphatase